jgi:hypothetical protein
MTSQQDQPNDRGPHELSPEDEAVELDNFDLNNDGRVSIVEDVRAELGIVDARLAQIAEQDGIKGKLAEGAHKLLDKLDND